MISRKFILFVWGIGLIAAIFTAGLDSAYSECEGSCESGACGCCVEDPTPTPEPTPDPRPPGDDTPEPENTPTPEPEPTPEPDSCTVVGSYDCPEGTDCEGPEENPGGIPSGPADCSGLSGDEPIDHEVSSVDNGGSTVSVSITSSSPNTETTTVTEEFPKDCPRDPDDESDGGEGGGAAAAFGSGGGTGQSGAVQSNSSQIGIPVLEARVTLTAAHLREMINAPQLPDYFMNYLIIQMSHSGRSNLWSNDSSSTEAFAGSIFENALPLVGDLPPRTEAYGWQHCNPLYWWRKIWGKADDVPKTCKVKPNPDPGDLPPPAGYKCWSDLPTDELKKLLSEESAFHLRGAIKCSKSGDDLVLTFTTRRKHYKPDGSAFWEWVECKKRIPCDKAHKQLGN